jgi:hypothetical protein
MYVIGEWLTLTAFLLRSLFMTDDAGAAGFVVGSAAMAWKSNTLQRRDETKQVNKEIKST